jgi:hypothetical protein
LCPELHRTITINVNPLVPVRLQARRGNAASQPLSPDRTAPDLPGTQAVPARVLTLSVHLCGREPPTFVVFGQDENTKNLDRSSALYLKIYNGNEIPPASDAIGMDNSGRGFWLSLTTRSD